MSSVYLCRWFDTDDNKLSITLLSLLVVISKFCPLRLPNDHLEFPAISFPEAAIIWLATGIATSGQVQLRKSAIHGLPVTLRMPRVKSDKSDWFWSQYIVFAQPFKTGMSLGLARGPDISSAWQKRPLGTRLSSQGLSSFRLAERRGLRDKAGFELRVML